MTVPATGLVDFFVVGVQKAGTTALAQALRQHPQIEIAARKEAHHFDRPRTDWSRPDHAWLHGQFDWTRTGVRRGEATPAYIYWPAALPRLQAYNPRARLIVGLRHPAFRAFSHWRMERQRGRESLDFLAAISPEGRARVAAARGGVHRVYSYVERGLYAGQIRRLLALFPKPQVLFYRVDELWSRPAATLGRIETHLGVGRREWPDAPAYTVPLRADGPATMSADARVALDRLFRDDLHETAALTGLDLADWLRPHYAEPMRAPADHG
jgi:Sulfotransferase domain